MWRAWATALLVAITACVGDDVRTCADGVVCPSSQACAPVGGGCVDPGQVAACEGQPPGGACTLVGIGTGACREGLCVVAGCGDGVVDVGEGCDDGNDVDDDACTNACAAPRCGDGARQADEACDAGAANGDDRACTTRCVVARCGDNLVHAGVEACDAGAANADGEACTSACTRAACGDGHVFVGVEACDDGNTASGDGCRQDCGKVEACGDAVVDVGEACDDGNGNAADGCDACATTRWLAASILGGVADATSEPVGGIIAVAVDRRGNAYVVAGNGFRVWRLDAATGVLAAIAGTGERGDGGDGGPATSAGLAVAEGIAVDGLGNVYLADTQNDRIRRIAGPGAATPGVITTIAGTSTGGFSGDGGPATSAQLRRPRDVAVDGLGNVYVADSGNLRIRRIAGAASATPGVITTIAGTGVSGSSGDGGPATSARFTDLAAIALDAAGALFVVDDDGNRVRRIAGPLAPSPGIITTIAGTGVAGSSGDGGPATAAQLRRPQDVDVDAAGVVYIADAANHRVRRVAAGVITTVVGTGFPGYAGDGGLAVDATLSSPGDLALGPGGAIYLSDAGRLRWVTGPGAAAPGVIDTIAGDGREAEARDGAAATSTAVSFPGGLAVDPDGNVYVALANDGRVVRVDGPSMAAPGTVATVAGTGVVGSVGDGGPATAAWLSYPQGLALDAQGNLYVADAFGERIRRIAGPADPAPGTITTVAGVGGVGGFAGDGGPATAARLDTPWGLAIDADGNLYVADQGNHRIRRIAGPTAPVPGTITTIAGTGVAGYGGDGGAATSAALNEPTGLALDALGNLYVADQDNHRIRRIGGALDPVPGRITTVAGTGTAGSSGDGGAATAAALRFPTGVAFDNLGNLLIADSLNVRIRRVAGPAAAAPGVIRTIAGTGVAGYDGDGGAATAAQLSTARDVAVDAADTIYVAHPLRVRRIDGPTALVPGRITTLAGLVDVGRMGPVAQAQLATPGELAVGPALTLVAGGGAGVVQALRATPPVVEVALGRYPQDQATGALARFRDASFGTVGGVAYDAAASRIYLSETTAHRLHVVTIVDVADPTTWTIAALVNSAGTAGFADGPAATARLRAPGGLFLDEAAGTLLIADSGNHVIRALDLVGGVVSTVAGTPATRGYFGDGLAADAALLFAPAAVTRCAATGDLFIADLGNHRVRRVAAGTGIITTVLGDGVAASSGEGEPAATFPVDTPRALACDVAGNLYVTSTTAVRLLPAAISLGSTSGDVDGTGPVQTIYGVSPRTTFPEVVTSCLAGLLVVDDATVHVSDRCAGMLVELWRQQAP